jgi:hypothetical protein
MNNKKRLFIEQVIEREEGILRLEPAWVARNFLPPGRRFRLREEMFELGRRGGICERWLGSTTRADNPFPVPDEGLSFLALDAGARITLKEAVETAPEAVLGSVYAKGHDGLGRLAKVFDYAHRIPFHLHPMKKHATLVGRNSKEEAYYYPEGVALGDHPESYLGLHPSLLKEENHELLLPHLVDWKDDRILQHSKGYQLNPGDGFHIPAGIVHAPGTALTIELQEDSDVFAMMQARVGPHPISKELLFKDVRPEDRAAHGERFILEMIDWEQSCDPFFYENRHTPPIRIPGSEQPGGHEEWIFYNTNRFSGKRLVVKSGTTYRSRDEGVCNLLVWEGNGLFGGKEVRGGDAERDELLLCHERAVATTDVENRGNGDLVILKFFGPDVSRVVPFLRSPESS